MLTTAFLYEEPTLQFPEGASFHFQLSASDKKGTYRITILYRDDTVTTWMTMPAGGEQYCPVTRKDDMHRVFTIGFCTCNDTAFYPYYRIAPEPGRIDMKYLAVYSFPVQE